MSQHALVHISSFLQTHLHGSAKRIFDVISSAMLMLALSPLLLLIALVIALDGWSAIYEHSRIGKNGAMFQCLKFRSMCVDKNDVILRQYLQTHPEAAKEWTETQKLKCDPRVTTIGKLLRRSSLDELPQLLNIIRGEMSLVGPRPIVKEEITRYGHHIADYYRVRPGLTGLWQVSGRNNVSYDERVQMDVSYVRNWSLWNDMMIICKTFSALLRGSGAY